MSRGFVILGIDTDRDRLKHAYALACSIKLCDMDQQVCLIVDQNKSDLVPKKYLEAFDYLVELSFGNTAYKDGFHGANLWQMRSCSPFEETIYVDDDTLFLNVDVDLLWDQFEDRDIAISNIAKTYRNTYADKTFDFEIEKIYDLPELYGNLIYFKTDSKLAIEWFKMADPCFQNWKEFYSQNFKEKKPNSFDKNVIVNTITDALDIYYDVKTDVAVLIDLSPFAQKFYSDDISDNWTDYLNFWFTQDLQLIVENSFISSGIVHYRDEQFLTDEILDVIVSKFKINKQRKDAA